METLAIHGGSPLRTRPFPPRSPFGEREVELVTQAIRSQNLFGMGGAMMPEFERRFGALYDAPIAVASTSGTSAVHVAIGAIDPDPGDEIITAPITDAGSIVPILYQQAIPVFADVDDTYNMDPEDVERQITPRTRAILAVHLFGNPCRIDAMADIAHRHGLWLIEDCSQAHLTRYQNKRLGTFGDVACFSLQQSKHMTTGDGGITVTRHLELEDRMSRLRDTAWSRKPGPRTYGFLGLNYRMTELQAAVGLAQLEKVEAVVERRHALGSLLTELIQDVPGIEPAPVTPGGWPTYWLYPLRVLDWTVDEFAAALSAEGIPAGARYTGEPIFRCMEALSAGKTFGSSSHPLDGCHGGRVLDYGPDMCPRTQDALNHLVTLSIHEHMADDDVRDMAAAVRKVADGLSRRR